MRNYWIMETKTELINNLEKFKNLKKDWNEILDKSNNKNIFLTWEWLFEWYRNLACNMELYIVIIKHSEEIIGIAPFIKNKKNNFKIIEFLGSSFVYSDYLDLIIKKEFEGIAIKELFSFLQSNSTDWDIIKLSDFYLDSINKDFILKEASNNSLILKTEEISKCPYITLPQKMEDFYRGIGHDTRYKIKKSMKKLMHLHKTSIISVNNQKLLEQAIFMMFELNCKRWSIEHGKGSFYTKNIKDFNLAISKRFLENGWLRFDYMEVENKMISYCYNFKFNNKIYGYSTSYNIDKKFIKYSPGKILQIKCIESAIKENINEYDMLRGTSKYKYNLTKKERQLINIFVAKNNLKTKIYFISYDIYRILLKVSRKIVPNIIRKKIGERYFRK